MKNKFLPWLIAAGFALLFLSTLIYKEKPPNGESWYNITPLHNSVTLKETKEAAKIPSGTEEFLVSRVIDGDTIELAGGTRVRYIGIDTPEPGQCFSGEATEENKKLVEDKKARLETDVQKFDKYGRTLAYVFVGNLFVNEELVRRGFAKVYTYPPDVKYTEKFVAAQKEARENKLGLWAEGICLPGSQGDDLEPQTTQPSAECGIKGNISSSGEKIYHTPGQRYYEKTKIEENKGERWFCTEEEAEKEGWRKSKI
ncbi:MAG: thermonuclease family protein [Candidatus Blackburnbacteria bacterium]|nr:thermonuclease family protein [Candidatus Blackburnbacteria bacterium]